MTDTTVTASRFAVWIGAIRPRTLTMSLAPVIVGATLAWSVAGKMNILAALVAMVSAACIQIATNLFNDAKDFERGGDGPDRLGPPRAAATGALDADEIKRAACGFFAFAALGGLYLIVIGGVPILLLGLLSIAAGWAYTGGPLPISYSPFGELFVIAFFGVGAVCGTFWLCAGEVTVAPLLAGLAVGLFAAGVLMVNNYRDAVADARVGRRTLAIVAGETASRWLFAFMMLAPFVLVSMLALSSGHAPLWTAMGALPLAAGLTRRFFVEPRGPAFNSLLVRTAQTQAVFSLLLCLGALL
jgi:1,4-dihydroxy-2-naphthoate octaprenyltransferase